MPYFKYLYLPNQYVCNNFLFCTSKNTPILYNATKEEDIIKVGNTIYSETDMDDLKQLKTIIK